MSDRTTALLVYPDGTIEGEAAYPKPGKFEKDVPKAIRARDVANAKGWTSWRQTPAGVKFGARHGSAVEAIDVVLKRLRRS